VVVGVEPASAGACDGSAEDEPSFTVVDVDVELDDVPDELPLSDEEAGGFDDPGDEELDDEPAPDGSANATGGMVATADPTPSATASAPTRPIHMT
jgi:hypothetical protein